MKPQLFLLLCIIIASLATQVASFTTPSSSTSVNLNNVVLQSSRVSKHTALEARLKGDDDEVNVFEMEVDPFTLTAVGFGLIAFNFFVLANVSIMINWFPCPNPNLVHNPNFNILSL